MDDRATKRGGGAVVAVVLVAVLVILPMLYVLSAGPVVWMVNNDRIDPSWLPAVEVAYTPLEWVAENVPVVGPAIMGYLELWVLPYSQTSPATPPAPPPSGS